ncbi:hypothetical protein LEP1GSC133_2588 [Leptospira borgpetersenii serovar Pomona str. 200901868]|uniref:Uncharacterized protein n=2 Tax=Leptospira borgpetersenii TaxID=174 RepID=M3HUQ9_LEPBO|nr:hypothetical protein LEP1GSC123_3747 [Leptospira borgpetersenii str. 200701203]EMO08584.1 hypothetical protein LEP1GSC137_1908 [Leptospira borgpetersenii str. Noumea 25]EMO61017.1 hypothetical protein LEP1GSC133_2588 [Leptospira borgpetersenii serovar Pomona str. 200901868]
MNLIRILILFAFGADSLWGSGIYLKGRVIVEGEEVRLSSVARIPDGFENRVLIQDLKRPVFVGPKDILKIYGDLNPIVVGKETLVLPLNHILKPEEIEESLTNEIKKNTRTRNSNLRFYLEISRFPRKVSNFVGRIFLPVCARDNL